MTLKIFKVERTDNIGWDEYDSFVVIASDKKEALSFHPDGSHDLEDGCFGSWVKGEDLLCLTVTEIGQANEGETARVVLASFNAG